VPQVQVSFDIDANGLLQVSATDRTTGRQQSVSIQGGSNLSEEEIATLIEEAERKASDDRRRRAEIDRRNRALTLVAQAERRLRDSALELGPYGAERQQRAVEISLRDLQDLLADAERGGDPGELDLAVSQLQEALYGLNRRLASERKQDSNPLQGLKNTLGSLKDELFSDDDWEDWDRGGRGRDPWAEPSWSAASRRSWDEPSWDNRPWQREPERDRPVERDREPAPLSSRGGGYDDRRYDDAHDRYAGEGLEQDSYPERRYRDRSPERPPASSRSLPYDDDPWAED